MNDQIPTPEEFLDTTRWPGDDDDYDGLLRQRDEHQHAVGESVTVGGIDFTKIGELPFGPGMLHVIPPSPMERIATALESIAGKDTKVGRAAVTENGGEAPHTWARKAAEAEERIQAFTEEMADLEAKHGVVLQVIADVEAALGKSKAAPALAAKAVIDAYKNPPAVPEPVEVDPYLEQHDPEPDSALHTLPAPVLADIPAEHLPGHTKTPYEHGDQFFCRECSGELQEWITWPCPTITAAFNPLGVGEAQPLATGPEEGHEEVPQPAHDAPVEEWRAYARSKGFAGPDIDKANRSQIRTALGVAQPVSS